MDFPSLAGMQILRDSLSYPIRGSGKYLLLTAAILSVAADVVSFAPMIGLIARLLIFGYLSTVYFQIIQSTATGSREAPMFPETANLYEDIISPAMQVIVVFVTALLPSLIAAIWLKDATHGGVLVTGLHWLGLAYAPMAMLAVCVLGFLGAMSPHIVLPAICRCGWIYAVVVGALLLLYLAEGLISESLGQWIILCSPVMAVVGSYVMMANGRMLGLMFREKREDLNWI